MAKRKKQSFLPVFIIGLGAIILLVALVWISGGFTASTLVQATATNVPMNPEVDAYRIQRVSVEEAKAAFDQGIALFLDVRDAQSFASQHISGAYSLPLGEINDRIDELDPEQWIITY